MSKRIFHFLNGKWEAFLKTFADNSIEHRGFWSLRKRAFKKRRPQ